MCRDEVVVTQLLPVHLPQLAFHVRVQLQVERLHLCPQRHHVVNKRFSLKLVPPHLSIVTETCDTIGICCSNIDILRNRVNLSQIIAIIVIC